MRLIDADAFLAENCADRLFYDPEYEIGVASCDECNCHCLEIDCDRIMDAPTIDAVPVVRCGECKHHVNAPNTSDVWCENVDGLLPREWFCADGERKDDERG